MAISVVDPTQSVLEAAMRGAELRQTLLTSDLANADTPNFEPQDVDFQSQLASAMNAPTASPSSLGQLTFQQTTQPQTTNTNGNGVDADETSADLAENGLLYDALTEVLSAHNSMLEYAMGTK
ncbi:MAG: flagellar basal body rod protein FlgB [Solirubrobacteraceae bacterium]